MIERAGDGPRPIGNRSARSGPREAMIAASAEANPAFASAVGSVKSGFRH